MVWHLHAPPVVHGASEYRRPDYNVYSHEVDIYLSSDKDSIQQEDTLYADPWWWWFDDIARNNKSNILGSPLDTCFLRVKERIKLHFPPPREADHSKRLVSRYLPSAASYLRPIELRVNKASASRDRSPPMPHNNFALLEKPAKMGHIDVSRAIITQDTALRITWLNWLLQETESASNPKPTKNPIVGNFTVQLDYMVAGVFRFVKNGRDSMMEECEETEGGDFNELLWPQTLDALKAAEYTNIIRIHVPDVYNITDSNKIKTNPEQNATVWREDGKHVISFDMQLPTNLSRSDQWRKGSINTRPLLISVIFPKLQDKCIFHDFNKEALGTPIVAGVIILLMILAALILIIVLFTVNKCKQLIGLHGIGSENKKIK